MVSKHFSDIWYNENVNQNNIVILALMLCIVYLFIFHIFIPLGKNFSIIRNVDKMCVLKNDNNVIKKILNKSRGREYYITGESTESLNNCGITLWEFSHFLMHIFVGYWFDLRWSLLIGCSFEAWEWHQYKCENIMDVVYNSLGAIAGGLIRSYIKS